MYGDEKEMNFAHNKERVDVEYFIDRDGKIKKYKGDMYETVISMHYEIALQYFPNLEYPKDHVLEKVGWIMIGGTGYDHCIADKYPSQA